MNDEDFLPIEDPAALRDKPCLVRGGPNYARAFWTGGMWAYWDGETVQQIEFEPTHYRLLKSTTDAA